MDLELTFGTTIAPSMFGWMPIIFFFIQERDKKMDRKGFGEFSMWFPSQLS